MQVSRSGRSLSADLLFAHAMIIPFFLFFFQAEDGIRDIGVTGVQTCALPISGLVYSGCVMGILGAHELGHFLQARRNGVPASLPFFIPFPISPFGTMGAVIVQQSGVADRKSMFDIAITGPLAGLVLALPLAYFGICNAKVQTFAGLPGRVTIY